MMVSETDVFPMPIVSMSSTEVTPGTLVNLRNVTGTIVATLTVEECWLPDLNKEFVSVFGTDDDNHPYIKYLKSKSPLYYLSGSLESKGFTFHSNFMNERRTPAQLKEILGGRSCIAFQTLKHSDVNYSYVSVLLVLFWLMRHRAALWRHGWGSPIHKTSCSN
jgi:ATP sulfurylase